MNLNAKGTAWIKGLAVFLMPFCASAATVYLASSLPGVVTGTSVVNGTTYGTYNATALNAYTIPGNFSVTLDVSGTTTGPIELGSNTTVQVSDGVTITQGADWTGPILENYHQVFVNLSGSSNFGPNGNWKSVTPAVSGTQPLIGDSNIVVNGSGTLVGNYYTTRLGNTRWSTTIGGTTANSWAVGMQFFGVSNLRLQDFTIYGGRTFQILGGNLYNPTIENVTCSKPGGVSYDAIDANDDGFHFQGSVYYLTMLNCRYYNNGDNCFSLNPGEEVSPMDFSAFPGTCIGPIVEPYINGFYTNAQGPGFFCYWSGTGGPLECDIINPDIENVTLDTPPPAFPYQANSEILSTMEFAGNFIGGMFNNWTIGNRGNLEQVGISGTCSNVTFQNFNFTAIPAGVSPFGFGVWGTPNQNRSNIAILDSTATIIGGTSSSAFVSNGEGPGVLNGLTISNNYINGFQGGVYDDADPSWQDAGQISNVGGTGNTVVNAPGPMVTGNVSGVWGQLADASGARAAQAYAAQISEITGTNPAFQTPAAIASQAQVSAWLVGLTNLGVLQNCVGQVLAQYQGSPDATQLVRYGGLGYNPQIWDGGWDVQYFTTGINGGIFNGWSLLLPTPPALMTGSSLTLFAVDNCASTSSPRGILSLGALVGTFPDFSLEGWGTSQATFYVTIGPNISTALASGTNGLVNQPVGYFATYDGATGIALRTMQMTGTADVTTKATLTGTAGPLLYPSPIGLGGSPRNYYPGESTTIHDWMIISGSLSASTQTAVKTLWQNTIGAAYFQAAPPSFSAWQSDVFDPTDRADPAISGGTATPVGDGVPNLMKYALNLNPWTNSASRLPVGAAMAMGGSEYLTIRYTQLIAPSDIIYTPEVSGDLQTWNSGLGYVVPVSVTQNGDGVTETVVEQDLTPVKPGTPRFIRLQITAP